MTAFLSGWRSHALLVLLAAAAVYANALANGFAYDDVHIIPQNPRVQQLANLRAIWLTPYWPILGAELGLYRPLTIFAFALEWVAGSGAPWVFHAVNLLLHGAASVLVLLLLRSLVTPRAALVGGLIFAVHPLHTEAVANVVGQAELLAGVAVLLACVLHVTRPAGARVPAARLAAITALYALALLAKESAIVLPGLLIALDLATGRVSLTRAGLRAYLAPLAVPLVLLAAAATAYLALRVDVLGSFTGVDAGPSLPFLREQDRLLNALRAWPEYVRLLFFPSDLVIDYAPGVLLPVNGWTLPVVLGTVLLLGCCALAALTPAQPALGLAPLWFLVTILPVSNLFFPIGVLIAERTLYLPSVAASLVAAYAWAALEPKLLGARARTAALAAAAILLLLGARTIMRNPDWRSTETVLSALYRDHPESYRAQWREAARALRAGDTLASHRHWQIAYALWPRDSRLLAEMANFYLTLRRFDRAIPLLERSREMHPYVGRTEFLLAYSYLEVGRFADALAATLRAERITGPAPQLLDLRARAYWALGRRGDAVAAWRLATRHPRGDTPETWGNLARALSRMGLDAQAAAARDTARTRSP